MTKDPSTLLRPINRFPGEFFAIGLAFAIVAFLLAGPVAAMSVTALIGLLQVVLLRRERLNTRSTSSQLQHAEADAKHWQEKADSFMSELAAYKEAQRTAPQAAATDPESGLATLGQLEVEFVRNVAQYARHADPFSVVLFQVRDSDAHDAPLAPAVVAAAAQHLVHASGVEGFCRVARRGFAVMLNADASRAAAFAERAQARFAQSKPTGADGESALEVFGGVAQFDGRSGHVREMLTAAARDLHARMQRDSQAA